ncbi:A disintegrin and metalloproteinase with thrombospondin motifs adt-1-like [Asterias rubens]|uniref:A disintegrin and metalloproteinase with thrombospondin motifs adt-1-like n=1 Tax=Asterias rubens TaxID=7604 RepID=UPI00145502E3|nr:A disintegrin and metalloproteinase with thrombospondin motifs adt-1-like [Asterias rubens]
MTSVLRFLFVAGCTVQLLFLSTAFASSDRKPRVTGYCFGQRTPIGQRGRCTDEIRPPSNQTRWSGAKECCMLGGVGWTTKTNGKRCENACEEEEPVPYMKDVQSLVETPVMHKDKTNFQNDSNNTAPVLWSEWGNWLNCTASCGAGNMTRYRTCNSTDHCNGSNEETIPCNSTTSCQDLGNATWSVWGGWQNCTSPCGVGNVTRYRTCNGGQNCNGSSEETIPCDSNITCQVDGRWTAWGEWSDCDPCDNNSKTTRSRSCTNPPPSGDGSHCAGLQSMTRNCPGNCPDQNNGWSEWSDWTPCSAVQCGKQGFSLRSRSCTRMSPQTCPGNFLDINTCVAPGCSTGR